MPQDIFKTLVLAAGLIVFCVTGFANSSSRADDRFTPCAPAVKFIDIKVTSKTIAATPSAPARRVWVLSEIPTADQIQLVPQDPPVKNKILEVFQAIKDNAIEVGVGEEGNPDAPVRQLVLLLFELQDIRQGLEIRLPGGLTTSPEAADEGKTFPTRLCLKYEIPEARPTTVEINISTLSGDSTPIPGIPSFTLADAGAKFIGKPEGAIRVQLAYGQADLDDVRRNTSLTAEDPHASVRRELLEVAAMAYTTAVDKKLLAPNGQPLVDRRTDQGEAANTALALRNTYNLNVKSTLMRWGLVETNAQVRDLTDNSPWIITVKALQFAQAVDIQILKSAEESGVGLAAERKLDEKRNLAREKLRADNLSGFAAKPGTIITAQEIEQDEQKLREDRLVKNVGEVTSDPISSPPNLSPPPQNLIYTVSRKLAGEKTLTGRVGGGYSPEDHVLGSGGFEELNMLGLSETAKLDFSGGPQVQRLKFNFTRPFQKSGRPGWELRDLGINAQIFRDTDQRLANLTAEEIEAREIGSEAKFSFGYDSFGVFDHASANCLTNPARKRTRIYFFATPAFGYRDVNIREDDLLLTVTGLDPELLPRNRTQVTTLALDTSLGLTHDFRRAQQAGLGKVNVSFNGRLQRGFRLFGSDYKYNKANASVTFEAFFGSSSPRDYFFRYTRVMATATHGTPVFELFRLGGAGSVRGIEEGEFIGRKMSADQFEVGINVLLLWQLIARNDAAKDLQQDECEGEVESAMPVDLAKTYLKVFYDLGRINDRDSFSPDIVQLSARGYGLAFELRQLGGQDINLTIGYAYSPESRLHRSGTVYTGVSYSF